MVESIVQGFPEVNAEFESSWGEIGLSETLRTA